MSYVCASSVGKRITALVVVNFSNTTRAKPLITTPRASPLGPEALGVVIGGLACVVFEKLPTTREVMLYYYTHFSFTAKALVLVNVQRARVVNEKLLITNVVMLLPLDTRVLI